MGSPSPDHHGSTSRAGQPGQRIQEQAHVLGSIGIGAGWSEGCEGVDHDQVERVGRGGLDQEVHMGGKVDGGSGGGVGEHGPAHPREVSLGRSQAR